MPYSFNFFSLCSVDQLEGDIQQFENLNKPFCSNDDKSPLHAAAMREDNDVARMLLNHGAQVNIKDKWKITPLHEAAEKGYHDTVQLLIDRGADVSAKDHEGNTPLHKTKCKKVADILIRNGASVRDKNYRNRSALHCVYEGGFSTDGVVKDITELLLSHGAEADGLDRDMKSPLHFAALHQYLEASLMLIQNGARINGQDMYGDSPLHLAIWKEWQIKRNLAYVELLLNQGASLNVQNFLGITPLHLAASQWGEGAFSALLQKGVKPDVQDDCGATALHCLATNEYYNKYLHVSQLLACGFSPFVKNHRGERAYDHLFSFGLNSLFVVATYFNLSSLAGGPECKDEDIGFPLSEERKEKAVKELERMKTIVISDQVCLYNIFSQFKRPSYLFHEGVKDNIEQLFQSPGFHNQFPMYANVLKGAFNRSIWSRYYLTRKATRSMLSKKRKEWCQLTPEIFWEDVCEFLSRDDLTNLIDSEL